MTWAPDYCTLDELKDYVSIQDNSSDALVALWITTVSRNVNDFCGRQFGQVDAAEDRYYPGMWDRHERAAFIEIDDVQDTTGLTVTDPNGNVVDPTTYQLMPRNAPARGRPYERIRLRGQYPWSPYPANVWPYYGWQFGSYPAVSHEFTVNARYGWTAEPAAVKTGMFLQGARLNARRNSPFGISGSPQEQGEIRLLAQLDPDFRTSLKPFVRTWWAA